MASLRARKRCGAMACANATRDFAGGGTWSRTARRVAIAYRFPEAVQEVRSVLHLEDPGSGNLSTMLSNSSATPPREVCNVEDLLGCHVPEMPPLYTHLYVGISKFISVEY